MDTPIPAPQIDQSPVDLVTVELTRELTREEQLITELCGHHAGAAAPIHMVVKTAIRLHRISVWSAGLSAFFARGRKWLIAGITTAAVNMTGIVVYAVHRVEASGAAQERAANQDRLIQELREDVRDLRRELRRIGGATEPTGAADSIPDRLTYTDTKGPISCPVSRLPAR